MEAIIESEKLVKNKLKQMNLNLEEKQVELESLQEEFTTAIQIKGWSCKICPTMNEWIFFPKTVWNYKMQVMTHESGVLGVLGVCDETVITPN